MADRTAGQEWKAHWAMVMAGTVGMSFYAFFAYSNQMFIEPLEAEFGWPRAQISMGYTIYAFVAFLFGPAVGALIDRWGARRLALPGMAMSALAFAALGLTGSAIWNWFALWLVLALTGMLVKSTVWSAAASNAFVRSRGLAIAVILSGSAIAQFLGPLITGPLIREHGWRQAYHYLGLGWGGIGFVLVLLFFFDTGGQKARNAIATATPPPGLTFREALRSRAVLLIFAANVVTSLLGSGVSFHLKPILTGAGLADSLAAQTAALAGISGIAGKLISGWLLDRIEGNLVPFSAYALAALGFFLLMGRIEGREALAIGVLVLGFTSGAGLAVSTYLISRYAGLRAFGAIYGTLGSMLMIGTGIGPVIAGQVHDVTGSYNPLLLAAIPATLIGASLMLGLGRYPDFAAPGKEGPSASA